MRLGNQGQFSVPWPKRGTRITSFRELRPLSCQRRRRVLPMKELSGETYPDRMAGGAEGIYKNNWVPVTPIWYHKIAVSI